MGTHYQGTEEERQALNTYIKLTRCFNAVESRIAQETDAQGLTVSQFGTLEALYHLGPMCQGEIGGKILKSSGNMTMVIDNLEKRGLVRRERDPEDRRQVFIHLTEAGEALIADVLPGHVAAITSVMRILTPEEQQALAQLCKMLGKQMREEAEPANH